MVSVAVRAVLPISKTSIRKVRLNTERCLDSFKEAQNKPLFHSFFSVVFESTGLNMNNELKYKHLVEQMFSEG